MKKARLAFFRAQPALLRRAHETLGCVFVAPRARRLVRRLSTSNHISALNDAITHAAGDPADS